MAIVVMVVLFFTAGAGVTLLSGVVRGSRTVTKTAAAPRKVKTDPYAPPSLARARAEQVPWGRALLEFTHPALAVVGIGMWIGFTLIHQRALGAVALVVLTAAALAGVTWFTITRRGGVSINRRTLAAHAAGAAFVLALALIATVHP
jgi:hypothetical protein